MDYYTKNKFRVWEVDFMRGIAIILMVFLHVIWSAEFFGIYSFNLSPFVLMLIQRFTAGTFLFLVGVSLVLSYSRIKDAAVNIYKKYFLRGLKIFGYGMIISIATVILSGRLLVTFGVLHLIGVGIILSTFFLKLKKTNLVLGLLIIILGLFTASIDAGNWLFWLGFKYPGFALDYFPIMPWFGVILLGIFFGNTFYQTGKGTFHQKSIPLFGELIAFLGRYSLLIYFLHIIIIVIIVALLGRLSFG